jgi:hypothetical protein
MMNGRSLRTRRWGWRIYLREKNKGKIKKVALRDVYSSVNTIRLYQIKEYEVEGEHEGGEMRKILEFENLKARGWL